MFVLLLLKFKHLTFIKLTNMPSDFLQRHLGPDESQIEDMLSYLGFSSLDEMSNKVLPKEIHSSSSTRLPKASDEMDTINRLKEISENNLIYRSFIGMGYYGTFMPGVIQRNIFENPGWYTQYTPYQAEISQGRLEALLNYQTMVSDLTGLPISNASLLDEATAAAEAMTMFYNNTRNMDKNVFLVSDSCHPQTIDVLKTRATPLGIELIVQNVNSFNFEDNVFGVLLQYPDTNGSINDHTDIIHTAHENDSYVCMATDLLALTLLKTPGEMGSDAAVGSAQRFGVPMGYGGPHAAFFSTTEQFKRKIPGRLIGVSQDSHNKPALRMALQTREQHIRREKATSNICTAQVLLAVISGMYAVYHGGNGLVKIARRVNELARILYTSLKNSGYEIFCDSFFDTIIFRATGWEKKARDLKFNFRVLSEGLVGISIDETTKIEHLKQILSVFDAEMALETTSSIPKNLERDSEFLQNNVFNDYRSETEMLRYIHKLEKKDLSLNTSMIPLGSCTMKLNSTTEMTSVTWPEISNIHPFAPDNQVKGYKVLINELNKWLVDITGFDSISMQPNSGSQGEYTGLMVIRAYHLSRGNKHRNICLIPSSAHGTNPASAVMAGMQVVVIDCDRHGNIDADDLKSKVEIHKDNLSAMMITYPSTHGVFESSIKSLCDLVHEHGGQVYMDGANLNALVGLCKPGELGADVMHINLHKTFCIPHGGGGPGMGPIVCKNHLTPFLPRHIHQNDLNGSNISAVSAAPFGSSSILPISWSYIAMMGAEGLKKATQVAILNANYLAKMLADYYPILYSGKNGFYAHEFIIDIRPIKEISGINEEDIAKRLMDYGFHAPTMSWPVPGTMMIEPTESESKTEIDRFCQAMILIKKEIDNVVSKKSDPENNPLKNAPHTAEYVLHDDWNHPYSRQESCFPMDSQNEYKYWPPVGRIDNAFGDRNLVCTCPDVKSYDT